MTNRCFFHLFLTSFFLFGGLISCVHDGTPQPRESIRVIDQEIRFGRQTEFIVLPGLKTYAVQVSEPRSIPLVVQVRLFDQAADVSGWFRDDARHTGESVFTLVSENLNVDDLVKARPRLSWWGDVFRGFQRPYSDPVRRSVHVVVSRKIGQGSTGRQSGNCPIWLFGDSDQVYTITTESDERRVIARVQVSSGVANLAQADALMNGVCLTPDLEAKDQLKSFELAGRVTGKGVRGRNHRLIWSKIETITSF